MSAGAAAAAALIGAAAAPIASADSGPVLLDQAGTDLAQGDALLSSISTQGLGGTSAEYLQFQEAFQNDDVQDTLNSAETVQDNLSATLQSNSEVVSADEQLVSADQSLASADQAIAADPSALGNGFDGFSGVISGDPFELEFSVITADFGALLAGAQVDEVDFLAAFDPGLLPFADFDPSALFSL